MDLMFPKEPPTCWMWAMSCVHCTSFPSNPHFPKFFHFLCFPISMHQTHLQPILCVLRSALDRLLWMHRGWLILKWAEIFQQPPHLRIMFIFFSLYFSWYISIPKTNQISGKFCISGKFSFSVEILDFLDFFMIVFRFICDCFRFL